MGKAVESVANVGTNIATGGMVGYSDGGFNKGVVLDTANKASGGAVDKVTSGLKDTLFGKKEADTPSSVIDLGSAQGRALQETAIGRYGELLNQDTNKFAADQTAQQENQIRQNSDDQARNVLKLSAQRGLGNSSMGIRALLNSSADTAGKIGAVRAGEGMLANQLKNQNLTTASQGVNQILNEQGSSKVYQQAVAGGRKGGISGLLGAGVGAYMGRAQGASVGMNLGNAMGQM